MSNNLMEQESGAEGPGTVSKTTLVIQNGISAKDYWSDVWHHRELLFFLVWRDILVRYKQTVIGVSWVLIRPLITMIILSTVFGRLANLPSGEAPYTILVFTGLLPWFFFSNALSDCSNSLITNSALLSKVYFPRLIVPTSTVIVSSVDFFISIGVLIILMLIYGITPTWKLSMLPLLGLWVGLLALGLGLWFAALNVRYRDFRHIVPFLLQMGIYVSPVAYATSIIPEKWAYLYFLNPIAGIIEGFRWAILDASPNLYGVACSLTIALILMITGVLFFRSAEAGFADDI